MAKNKNGQSQRTAGSKRFWKQFWSMLKPSHKQIKILFVFIAVFRLSQLAAPYILKLIVDELSRFDAEQISYLLLLIAVFSPVSSLLPFWVILKIKELFPW